MIYRAAVCLVLATCFLFGADPAARRATIGPHHVDPGNAGARILAVVPLVGTGRNGDPIRPAYAPLQPAPGVRPDLSGILGFTLQVTDDRKHALVEFVARDRSAFKQIMADTRSDVKVFEKGKAKPADIEKEFKKYKKDFDINQMVGRVR
jgi:hypothetical protein